METKASASTLISASTSTKALEVVHNDDSDDLRSV